MAEFLTIIIDHITRCFDRKPLKPESRCCFHTKVLCRIFVNKQTCLLRNITFSASVDTVTEASITKANHDLHRSKLRLSLLAFNCHELMLAAGANTIQAYIMHKAFVLMVLATGTTNYHATFYLRFNVVINEPIRFVLLMKYFRILKLQNTI